MTQSYVILQGFIGEIKLWPSDSIPQNWMPCNGQTLPVSNYEALYAIVGDAYKTPNAYAASLTPSIPPVNPGNNSTNTTVATPGVSFNLPNLNGCVPIGSSSKKQTPPAFPIGSTGGENQHTLTAAEMALHTHQAALSIAMNVSSGPATISVPTQGAAIAAPVMAGRGSPINFFDITLPSASLNFQSVQIILTADNSTSAGGGAAHNNMQPYMALNYIICVQGMFPTRA